MSAQSVIDKACRVESLLRVTGSAMFDSGGNLPDSASLVLDMAADMTVEIIEYLEMAEKRQENALADPEPSTPASGKGVRAD